MKATTFAACIAAALSIAAQASAQTTIRKPPLIDDPAYARPHQLVDIGGGRRLNLNCSGAGSPTVVFDSGLGEGTETWAIVQAAIAKHNRACSYDRAGRGFSDAATRPSDATNSTEDLHALLHAAHIAPPYVLVGHSSAGMYVRVFADHYRDGVVGMVVVDGSHEDQSSRMWGLMPGARRKPKRTGMLPSRTRSV